MARCAYMHSRICSTLDDGKNFWNEKRNLGLIPKANDVLHGFSPEELNLHFSKISISSSEDPSIPIEIINNTSPEGFAFSEVTKNDVVLAVTHFRSQAREDDGIPQNIVAKAVTMVNHLTKLFNATFSKGIFPTE